LLALNILVVCDILTGSLPPNAALLGLFHAVQERLHAVVEARVGFYKIQNVELVLCKSLSIANSKVKPLSVSIGIVISF
jgi:hypothetical protein